MTNIVLTGFMASGKTTIGQLVANELSMPFIDMDTVITQRAQKSIEEIFSQYGELEFRRMESSLCDELRSMDGVVIATGGGALINPSNRQALHENGMIICLTADPQETLARIQQTGSKRPLLNVTDPQAEILRLQQARSGVYAGFQWQLNTTHLTLDETTRQVIAMAQSISRVVQFPGGSYPIHTSIGLLEAVGSVLLSINLSSGSRVAVVTNPLVAEKYAHLVETSLQNAGFKPVRCLIQDGEQHKNLSSISSLYDQFLSHGLDRADTVLSLGGGVTGDIAGFAASTYMRGIRFVQVPTTLLAMVDASVGGKTGVDLPQGKNLIGAFKQPEGVLIDPLVLQTLSQEELRSGLAEVIKHCIIGDPEMFSELERNPGDLSAWWHNNFASRWIMRSLSVKIDVVEMDPFEQNRRAVLNLGHTVGHALEKISHYSLRHGEAVGLGMITAARISENLNLSDQGLSKRLENLLQKWGLPTRIPEYDTQDIIDSIGKDKKKKGNEVRWVLPQSIGNVAIDQIVPNEVVKSVLLSMY